MIELIRKGIRCLRENGLRYTMGRIIQRRKKRRIDNQVIAEYSIPVEVRKIEESTVFDRNLKMSIITPLYNTDMKFLKEMIQSVKDQTYTNWELCLCDGSDEKHKEVGQYCTSLAEQDKRIRYKKLERNAGISENTNECVQISNGDFICLLDHDDILHPSALHRVVKAICDNDADFVYTDEAKFTEKSQKCFSPNFKPDFAKDELRAHNYICHFTAYSRKLMDAVGLYRPECDGSQDHDMVLRLTEKANKIVHIPEILYFWRVHEGSVSAGVDVKSYAVEAARKAVREQLERCGDIGKVSSIPPYQTLYKSDYVLKAEKLVSVIIYNLYDIQDMARCVQSMEEMTSYFPMEVCLIEGDIDTEIFRSAMRRLPTIKPLITVTKEEQKGKDGLLAALQKCTGEYIVFLHAASVVESKDWVKEMLMYAQREDVGAVGGNIYDGNHSVYSAGIAVDTEDFTLLHHLHRGEPWGSHGYEAGLYHVRNVTAVAGACLMIERRKLEKAGDLRVEMGGYLFVDLCLRLRSQGFLNVCTPFVKVVFWGADPYLGKGKRAFEKMWKGKLTKVDPYYNPNMKKYKVC